MNTMVFKGENRIVRYKFFCITVIFMLFLPNNSLFFIKKLILQYNSSWNSPLESAIYFLTAKIIAK